MPIATSSVFGIEPSEAQLRVGSPEDVTLSLHNRSDRAASRVTVSWRLPPGVTSTSPCRATIPSLPAGESRTFAVRVVARNAGDFAVPVAVEGLLAGRGLVQARLGVTLSSREEVRPVPDPPEAPTVPQVVIVSSSPTRCKVQFSRFGLQLRNEGTGAAVAVEATLSGELDGERLARLPRLSAGGEATLEFNLRPRGPGALRIVARVACRSESTGTRCETEGSWWLEAVAEAPPPAVVVGGDYVVGGKTEVTDAVIHRSTIGGGAPATCGRCGGPVEPGSGMCPRC